MNYNYYNDMQYAKIVASRVDLVLKIGPPGTNPYTDFKRVVLPPLDPTWERTSPEYEFWWYALMHECFHNMHMDDLDAMKAEKNWKYSSFLGTIHNVSIDYKIETQSLGNYRGRDALVHRARYRFAKEKIYDSIAKASDNGGPRDALAAVWVMDAMCRSDWIPEYKTMDWARILSPQAQGFLIKLLNHNDLFERYKYQNTGAKSMQVAKDIAAFFQQEGVELPPPPEGDASNKLEGEVPEEWKQLAEEIIMHSHEKALSSKGGTGSQGEFDPPDGASSNTCDWVPDIPVFDGKLTGDGVLHDTIHGEAEKICIAKQIRKELESAARTRRVSRKRKGKLHKKSLVRAVQKGVSTDRIYRDRVDKHGEMNTAVHLLVDGSGSMSRCDKRVVAAAAALKLAEITSAVGVSTAISVFDEGRESRIQRVKTFNEGFNYEKVLNNFSNSLIVGSGNDDGDALLYAAAELYKTRAKRKILIPLSDGLPTGDLVLNGKSDRAVCKAWTKKVAQDLEALPDFELYAIGILSDSVSHYYKNYRVIKNISEFPEALLSVLRNKILPELLR